VGSLCPFSIQNKALGLWGIEGGIKNYVGQFWLFLDTMLIDQKNILIG